MRAAVPDAVWQGVTEQVENDSGFPRRNVLSDRDAHAQRARADAGRITCRRSSNPSGWRKQRLAPARIGYGTGVSYINVNRNIIDPKTRRWWEGPNYEGPSDKTVAVIKFETPERRADRGLLQLRDARGDRRSAGHGERRRPGRDVEVHRRFLRRQGRRRCGRAARRATRIRSTSSRRTTCAKSASRTMPSAASTSATRCLPAARA